MTLRWAQAEKKDPTYGKGKSVPLGVEIARVEVALMNYSAKADKLRNALQWPQKPDAWYLLNEEYIRVQGQIERTTAWLLELKVKDKRKTRYVERGKG